METKEIRCKIFAQYLGRDLKTQTGTVQLVGIHVDNFNRVFDAVVLNGNVTHTSEIENVKLILKPLSAITDEDAIWVAKMIGIIDADDFKKAIEQKNDLIEILCSKERGDSILLAPIDVLLIYQYLQSQGYDLPQHLLEGKTLNECGLAIYENE